MFCRLDTRRYWSILVVAAILMVAGCAGKSTTTNLDAHADFFAQLPLLPTDSPGGRSASDIVPYELTGADNWDNSGNVSVNGDSLTVTSAADRLDWVMYRYNLGLETSTGDLTMNLTADTGEAYVLVGDYNAGFWQLNGPYTGQAVVDLSGGGFISSGLAVYAVVAVYNGSVATIESSSLLYDNQVAAPSDYLNNMQSIFANNCMPCHSTANHTQGIILDTYWNSYENASAALAKALSDHAPSGSGTLDQDDKDTFQAWVDADKPYGADVTYTNYVSSVTSANCSPCHTSSSSGGVNFSTYSNAKSAASNAWNEIKTDGMPPGGPLSSEEKDKWLAWINQGTPE